MGGEHERLTSEDCGHKVKARVSTLRCFSSNILLLRQGFGELDLSVGGFFFSRQVEERKE